VASGWLTAGALSMTARRGVRIAGSERRKA